MDVCEEIGRPSSPASIMSFRSSLHAPSLFRQVSGRALNTSNEMYMLPADDQEQDRQTVEHRALYLTLDSLYAASELVGRAMVPRQNVRPGVLDIGTGSGIWAIDMAREFPHADVVGIDLTPPIMIPDTASIPTNCRFEIDDANLDLSHYKKSFNVVHMRHVAQGIQNFEDTIHRVAQTLRTDGVLLLVAASYQFFDERRQPLPVVQEGQPGWTATQTLFASTYELAKRLGGDIDAQNHWQDWLLDCPFYADVGAEDIYIPCGPWIPNLDNRCTRIAQLIQKNGDRIFGSLRPLLLQGGTDPAALDRWIATAEREWEEMRPPIFARYRYVWASRTKTKWYDTMLQQRPQQ